MSNMPIWVVVQTYKKYMTKDWSVLREVLWVQKVQNWEIAVLVPDDKKESCSVVNDLQSFIFYIKYSLKV